MKEQQLFLCSLCGGIMTVKPYDSGVIVICLNPCVSTCHENVFGYGKSAKEAWEVSKEKYRK